MKMIFKFFNGYFLTGIIMVAIYIPINLTDTYMKERRFECTVLFKDIIPPAYKRSGKFLLVMETEGMVFTHYAPPGIYYLMEPGKKIYMTLRRFDIRQNHLDTAVYFFLQLITLISGLMFLIWGIVIGISSITNKDEVGC